MTVFSDSNSLIYPAGDDRRAERIEALVQAGGIISVQVLNEVANVPRRKFGWDADRTERHLTKLRGLFDVYPLTLHIHDEGLAIHKRYGFSIWDSMIVAAALITGCNRLITEDLSSGQTIRPLTFPTRGTDSVLRLVNPFTQPG